MTPLSNAYYEYLPQGYSSSGSQKYPLMIFVHGSGETGDGSPSQISRVLRNGPPKLISQGIFPNSFNVKGQTFKFIVLSPQFTVWPDDINIDDIINYAIKNYHIDTSRIYLTGLSMGGGVVWQYAGDDINYGKRIAAIVPIAGASWPAYFRCENIAAANIAVWATHNNGDPTVPSFYTVDYVNTIDTVPAPPNPFAIKTIFQSNTHDAWTATYDLNFKPNGLNVFEWMLQYSKASGTLAVSGLAFTANKKDDHSVILSWNTYSENNNRGFIIERSIDGNAFDSIGFVSSLSVDGKGAGYNFTDATVTSVKNYYRLRQVNLDNTYQLSAIKFIEFNGQNYFTVYPNPVSDALYIHTGFMFNNSTLNIYDISGRLSQQIMLNGSGTLRASVNKLPPGIYTAKIADGVNKIQVRFIKK
ncbi:MAG: T9SS type A sorting domain-containing protein [Bacteroidota bacterium]|nr:T9SS type A sorting domain-containing protein [Bacteroidota bacterium]